jgi:hypothetical protein
MGHFHHKTESCGCDTCTSCAPTCSTCNTCNTCNTCEDSCGHESWLSKLKGHFHHKSSCDCGCGYDSCGCGNGSCGCGGGAIAPGATLTPAAPATMPKVGEPIPAPKGATDPGKKLPEGSKDEKEAGKEAGKEANAAPQPVSAPALELTPAAPAAPAATKTSDTKEPF